MMCPFVLSYHSVLWAAREVTNLWMANDCLSEGRAWSLCCIGKCCLMILLWELGSTQLKEQFWHRVYMFTPRTPH